MGLFKFLPWILGIFCLGCHPQASDTTTEDKVEKPNLILIMADDLGYHDLGCYGNTKINTPNIDALAEAGLRLTNYHTNGVVCSPTRASLLTGLYPQEAGIEGVVTAKSHRKTGMSPERYTMSEFFQEAGYPTAIFGKWHLGYSPAFGPIVQGFDAFSGFVSGNVDYQSHIDQEGYADWWEGKKLRPEEGYLTEIITELGIRFMEEVEDEPFFLYLPHGAPHYPYQGPADPADRTVKGDFPTLGSRKDINNAYQEMIESLDSSVGRIMAYLKENALLENTLVIFCSDNGAPRTEGSNAPWAGHKGQLYEGGHRVPAIFYWKDKIEPGTSDQLVMSMDIFPTIADLFELDTDQKRKLSGQSVAGLLAGGEPRNAQEERIVFWRFKDQKAARRGKWKLLIQDGQDALFNLEEDQQESTDVKENNTDIYHTLKQALEEWEAGLKEEIRA